MFWADKLADRVSGPQIVNDSKTPSGRVHVGALRGVLIHDAMFRTLRERGLPARYLFGVDDYDPLDEIPAGQREHFERYLGVPLSNVPPPPGSDAPDMAEHYIREFFDIFDALGVRTERYRMRDVYRSGRFNEVIDIILRHADVVRQIYKEVSHSDRPGTWHPFQVICEQCGRIGTTEVTAYDGKEVVYTCRPDLVTWARGCGHAGKVSPFDGYGKLPWKLEWAAKWKVFGVTIEGAGKDHNTKGGSRDVAAECCRRIFDHQPPLNIPYEFFLVGGAKMSSSKGLGASAREIADLLPPEALRFLIIRTQPKQPVNFSPDEKSIVKLFNDFDRLHWRVYHDPKIVEEEKRVYFLSVIEPPGDFFDVGFPLVVALVQLPHVDMVREVERRKGGPLTAVERHHLEQRVAAARHWLEHYASDDDKFTLQPHLPARARDLGATQRAFLHLLAAALPDTPWNEDALQAKVFEVARATPIAQPLAFQAIYRVLLDRDSGPKAGNLLAFLDLEFVVRRFRELPCSKIDWWRETAVTEEALDAWITAHRTRITAASVTAQSGDGAEGPAAIELAVTLDDGKTHVHRVLVDHTGAAELHARSDALVRRLESTHGITIHAP